MFLVFVCCVLCLCVLCCVEVTSVICFIVVSIPLKNCVCYLDLFCFWWKYHAPLWSAINVQVVLVEKRFDVRMVMNLHDFFSMCFTNDEKNVDSIMENHQSKEREWLKLSYKHSFIVLRCVFHSLLCDPPRSHVDMTVCEKQTWERNEMWKQFWQFLKNFLWQPTPI